MIASTQTLTNFLDNLPRTLRGRYSANNDAFGITRANHILSQIQKEIDSDFYRGHFPLILSDGITWYEKSSIDSSIRKILGIYEVPPDGVNPDMSNPVPFRDKGTHLELRNIPVVDTDDDFTGTVTAASGALLDRFIDTGSATLAALDDDKLRSTLCGYTDASLGTTTYFVVAGNDSSEGIISLNGNVAELPVAGDTYSITYNYFMVFAKRYITRVSGLSTAIDIPQDWEELFELGLRWKFAMQTEENDKDVGAALKAYNTELMRVKGDEQRKHGDNPNISPRDIPSIYDSGG